MSVQEYMEKLWSEIKRDGRSCPDFIIYPSKWIFHFYQVEHMIPPHKKGKPLNWRYIKKLLRKRDLTKSYNPCWNFKGESK